MNLFHRISVAIVGLRLRASLRRDGYDRREIDDMMKGYDSRLLEEANTVAAANVEGYKSASVRVRGSFLDWLNNFLDSEFGKVLLDILKSLLLGLLATKTEDANPAV